MRLPIVLIIMALAVAGLSALLLLGRSEQAGGVDMAREIEALMQADRDFDEATAERGVEGWVSFFAKDGAMFGGGGRITAGHEAIRALMGPAFSDPNFSLRWQPSHGTVAASGDLGYTYGNWVLSSQDGEGNPVAQYGRYVSIWKKQADGSWKVVLDIGTTGSDTPPEDL